MEEAKIVVQSGTERAKKKLQENSSLKEIGSGEQKLTAA